VWERFGYGPTVGPARDGRWTPRLSGPENDAAVLSAFCNEVGIIAQFAGSLFERRLPPGFLVSHFAVLNCLARLEDGKTPLCRARAFQVPKTTMTGQSRPPVWPKCCRFWRRCAAGLTGSARGRG
jgi:hypothetical protein